MEKIREGKRENQRKEKKGDKNTEEERGVIAQSKQRVLKL